MTIEEGNRMIEENFALLGACVKRLKQTKYRFVPIDDLWGVVDLAAVKAARAFDPAKGAFSTLLFRTAESDAYRAFYRNPRLQKNAATVFSLEATCLSDDDSELEYKNSIADHSKNVEEEALTNICKERADKAAPQVAEMVRLKAQGYTFREIGAACGTSRESVRKLMNKWRREYKKQ